MLRISHRLLWASALVILASVSLFPTDGHAQRQAKYGADFLAGGVGARALGMGGAAVGLAQDVTAGYWNPAGLASIAYPEVAYMHAERFAGVVAYDYGSAAFPINARSTVGLTLVRLGVDDIPNTLNAWDRERNQPLPNPENHITRFSYAHYALFVSYARALSDRFTVGVSAKMIRGAMGDFASSLGYSVDVGARYRLGRFFMGANVQDVSGMLQNWSVNQEAFGDAVVAFEDFEIPEGGVEYVLPVARFGTGVVLPMGANALTLGADIDVAFDGQKTYALNAGDLSFHPRAGVEFSFREVLALRAGVDRIARSERYGWGFTPSVGAGLHLRQLGVDYSFGNFGTFDSVTSGLGYSHRISLQLRLEQPRFKRAER